jgi:hypothetical protein
MAWFWPVARFWPRWKRNRRLPFGGPGQNGVVLEILTLHVLGVTLGVVDRTEYVSERVARVLETVLGKSSLQIAHLAIGDSLLLTVDLLHAQHRDHVGAPALRGQRSRRLVNERLDGPSPCGQQHVDRYGRKETKHNHANLHAMLRHVSFSP